jgi:hypothetical protein
VQPLKRSGSPDRNGDEEQNRLREGPAAARWSIKRGAASAAFRGPAEQVPGRSTRLVRAPVAGAESSPVGVLRVLEHENPLVLAGRSSGTRPYLSSCGGSGSTEEVATIAACWRSCATCPSSPLPWAVGSTLCAG